MRDDVDFNQGGSNEDEETGWTEAILAGRTDLVVVGERTIKQGRPLIFDSEQHGDLRLGTLEWICRVRERNFCSLKPCALNHY